MDSKTLVCHLKKEKKKKKNHSQQASIVCFLQHQQHSPTLKNSLWGGPDAGQNCLTSKGWKSNLKQIVKKKMYKNRLHCDTPTGEGTI